MSPTFRFAFRKTVPVMLGYLFLGVAFGILLQNACLLYTSMQSEEFAKWLSSNIYAGTFQIGTASAFAGKTPAEGETALNGGYPYLYVTELVKYDLGAYFNSDGDILLTVLNLDSSESTQYSSFLNGRFSYIDKNNYKFFDYKMFGNFITNYKLVFQLGLIPENLEYAVTARAYGKNASFNTDVSGGILDETKGNVIDIDKHKSGSLEIIGTDYGLVEKPNLIVLKIKLSVNGSYTEPWGIYREK